MLTPAQQSLVDSWRIEGLAAWEKMMDEAKIQNSQLTLEVEDDTRNSN